MTGEKRSAERKARQESVSVQIISSSADSDEPPKVISSQTLDVSEQGLKLYVDQSVESGCILDFCVEFSGNPRRFLLTGETRWCKKSDDAVYHVGLLILDAQGTDYEQWHQHMRKIEQAG